MLVNNDNSNFGKPQNVLEDVIFVTFPPPPPTFLKRINTYPRGNQTRYFYSLLITEKVQTSLKKRHSTSPERFATAQAGADNFLLVLFIHFIFCHFSMLRVNIIPKFLNESLSN